MKTKVVVAAGKPVPMQENSRRFISDKPVTVPLNSYYTRRLAFGELVEYVEPAPLASEEK
jgi:hypothetical protein